MIRATPRSLRGMVSAPHHLAAQAGRDVLAEGGSAVEAAVATAACLAVVYPHMTGIGGDGFWLVAEPDGGTWAIDGCGAAALAADRELYRDHQTIPWRGPLAANTVAGTVAGWQAALTQSGATLSLDRLLRDAIHHARTGVAVTAGGAQVAAAASTALRDLPGDYARVFEPEGRPLAEGDILRQPALATTLERLAGEGLDGFYRGALAQDIAADLATLGSPLAAVDLAAFAARAVEPLAVDITGARLFNLPPPTQGVAALLILALFDRLGAATCDGFDHVHRLVEATKQAFRWRDAHVGDPATMTVDAQALLDDRAVLDRMAGAIDPDRAAPWPHPPALGDTTWFGAADARGQVVSCIQSTYFEFGSGIVLPRTGITWQNRGCSFALDGDGPNRLRPGARPFHTLNPALARFEDGRVMAYGTMGGEGQPQTQAAIFTRHAVFGQPLQAAVDAPRWLLGRTWGEQSTTLKIEEGFDPALYEQLRAAGHAVETVPGWSSMMGHAGAIVRHPDGLIEGATDPRSDGMVETW
ncbi:gamma-glutamyltransferase family protein [Sphingomonas sp. SORGH_AS_0879]|uniref:gamma-glutamyltransferase family protein n=1 Tax=Sphingomonas sp. SORGH_AS_0879 TaxID=3041790 RepID=UPI002781DFBC|nr:gamma-glutamyltransferase family protein [Sphingomonas sp. SORGH_AS_0879]MDQ1228998.1 gamma-glutamyltranspeptidase [Sphingomonas sp. SORGH_AS_0879]